MIQDVKNRPISELFDVDSRVIYFVPKYQREYTWGKSHWEALFEDIVENDNGYFLGSFICINQGNDSLSPELEIVDGQQRFTTLALLFSAIYYYLQSNKHLLDEDQVVDLANLKRKLILIKDNHKIRVVPQTQNNNLADFRAVLAKAGAIPHADVPAYAGNRRIFRAYHYFLERIETIANSSADGARLVIKLLEKINRASLVKIEVSTHADAYTLFESLNNRGVPLTAIDLIKNKLLAKLEKNEPGQVDHYFEQWKVLLDCLGDDYATQERFFRHFYNAFKKDLKSIYNVPVATRSNLMLIYDNLISYDPKNCLDQILSAGKHYAVLLLRVANGSSASEGLLTKLRSLDRIQGAPSYLFLLFLMVRKQSLQVDDNDLEKVVDLLVSFFVRRNLTDTPPTRDLTRLFMDMVDGVDGKSGDAIVASAKQILANVSATDDIFRGKLSGQIYEDNSWVARFVLCALAEQGMTKETFVDLWRYNKNQFLWTVEHIFPQGENIPQVWVDMIADGDKERASQIQQSHVHTLGNLTISGFNSTLSNRGFIEKRDRMDAQGNFVGYRNGLKLNEDLAKADVWTVSQIEDRTTKLVDQALQLFRL